MPLNTLLNDTSSGRETRVRKETKENRENSEAAQRERYYATIHKVSHQAGDKIPEGKLITIKCTCCAAAIQ